MSTTSPVPSLSNASINLTAIRESSRLELINILKGIPGKKCIVLDPSLSRPLTLITEGIKVLKDNGMVDMRQLNSKPLVTEVEKIVYIVRPDIPLMKCIADHIHSHTNSKEKEKQYWLYFVPKKTFICEQILRDYGVRGDIVIGQCAIDMFPFEDDVLSMEMHNVFKELYLEGDTTSLSLVAGSIRKLQSLYGVIPNIKAIGNMSEKVANMILSETNEHDSNVSSEIDTILLMDRSVDLVTPMVSPLTYESLIDHIIGIESGSIKIDRGIFGEDDKASNKKASRPASNPDTLIALPLNSNDKVYGEFRDYNISILPIALGEKLKSIKTMYESRPKGDKNVKITELRDFVKKIPSLNEAFTQITLHINMMERINKTTNSKPFRARWNTEHKLLGGEKAVNDIMERLAKQEPEIETLRLIALQSLTWKRNDTGVVGGLLLDTTRRDMKTLNMMKREAIHTYGYHMLLTLDNMEKVGLIRRPDEDGGINYTSLSSKLNLVLDDNLAEPEDMSYVTSGYAPLSCRLVQLASRKTGGWKDNTNILKLLNTPVLSQTQSTTTTSNDSTEQASKDRKIMVVYFIGGITFAEIAALRQLQMTKDCPYDIVICTTKMINGRTLLESIIEKPVSAITAYRNDGKKRNVY